MRGSITFCQRGSNSDNVFVRGEDPRKASLKVGHHRSASETRVDDGHTLNAGLVLVRHLKLYDFSGVVVRTPCLPSGSAHVILFAPKCISKFCHGACKVNCMFSRIFCVQIQEHSLIRKHFTIYQCRVKHLTSSLMIYKSE